MIEGIHAKVDAAAAGFGLCVYVSVTLGRHEEALERRFAQVRRRAAAGDRRAWVAGETDALLTVDARDLARAPARARRALHRGRRPAGRDAAAPARAQARQPAAARRVAAASLTCRAPCPSA